VTRTWVRRSVIGPERRQAQQAVGDGVEADLGAMELAHDPRHRPALAADVAGARSAELSTVGLVVGHRSVVQIAVQERRMRRVDADLERLQPVAMPEPLEGEAVAGGSEEGVERRQSAGRRPLVTEPREQHAGARLQRIAALANALAQLRADRLGGGLEAGAVDAELPAVERAAQAVVFAAAEGQVGAAVRARPIEEAEAAGAVAKEDELLAEDAHRLDRARAGARVEARIELVEQRDRLPVAAQQRAAGSARADPRDEFVLLGLHVGSLASGASQSIETRMQRCS
jgi:hypothetical protein